MLQARLFQTMSGSDEAHALSIDTGFPDINMRVYTMVRCNQK